MFAYGETQWVLILYTQKCISKLYKLEIFELFETIKYSCLISNRSLRKSITFVYFLLCFTFIYISKTQNTRLFSNHSKHSNTIELFQFVPSSKCNIYIYCFCNYILPILNWHFFCTHHSELNNIIDSHDSNHSNDSKLSNSVALYQYVR